MNYFKYISIILVTIWVIFYSECKAEDFRKTVYLNSLTSYNQSRVKYFNIAAQMKKNNQDIEFYRSRRLEAMSNGDFNSEKYNRLSSIILDRSRNNERLALQKNTLSYKDFKISNKEIKFKQCNICWYCTGYFSHTVYCVHTHGV